MNAPIRRRLDIKSTARASDGEEYLGVALIDTTDGELRTAQYRCTLPDASAALGETGMSVGEFLGYWRRGERHLTQAAREYGRQLYRRLLLEPEELGDAWRQTLAQATGRGLRLEIAFPADSATQWRGQHVASLPFELMGDGSDYLFRRHGWSAVRRSSTFHSRAPRRAVEARPAKVQVAWANVQREGAALDAQYFNAHDATVAQLAADGQAIHLPPLAEATRRSLADTLTSRTPDVLVWIGHGANTGGGLLLHDGDDERFPKDPGSVVSATDFARYVRNGQVDIALLWSCHGAGHYRALDVGVAEALLHPDYGDAVAVLAAFSAVEAAAVAELSGALLRAWAANPGGDLEDALAEARDRMDRDSLTWARPVLFLRNAAAAGKLVLSPRRLEPLPGGSGSGRLRWLPQLPARTVHYVDLHGRLQQLLQDSERHAVVVLEGLAGIGKTELAVALAHTRKGAGADVAFVEANVQGGLDALRQTLGLLLRDAPFDSERELLVALHGRAWTLVLDNAEDLLHDEATRAGLLALLAGLCTTGPGFRAVVTSRHALASAGTADANRLFSRTVRMLDAVEAHRLFVAAAGPRLAPDQATPEQTRPLLDQLGGIARAIVLMAGQLGADADIATLCARLKTQGPETVADTELAGVRLPDSVDAHLHKSRLVSALNLSLKSAAAQNAHSAVLFDVLGAFPAGLSQALMPYTEFPWLGDALGVLLDHHLVDLSGEERRIVMSAPVRGYAWRRLDRNAGGHIDTAPLLHHLDTALSHWAIVTGDELGTEFSASAMLQLLVEEPNLLCGMERLLRRPATADAGAIVERVFRCLAQFAEYAARPQASTIRLDAIADQLQTWLPESRLAASAQLHIGRIRVRSDDLAGAGRAYEIALRIYRKIEVPWGEAHTLKSLGDLKARTDELTDAVLAYDAALKIYRKIKDRLGEANNLVALGDLKTRIADMAGADTAYEAALLAYDEVGHKLGKANTLISLGDLKTFTNDLAGAGAAYEAALQIFRKIENRLGEANTLQEIGELQGICGAARSGFMTIMQALQIHTQMNSRLGIGACHGYLARISGRTEAIVQATGLAGRAVQLFTSIQDRYGQMLILTDLGKALLRHNRTAATACLLLALDFAIEIGDPRADTIAQLIASLRRDEVDAATFASAIAKLRENAESLVSSLFDATEAAVASGKLDLYAPPPATEADNAG